MDIPNQKPRSIFKGLITLYLIFLAIFFALAPFLTLTLYAETDLSLSLLPQLIGFCLQGAFLVVVFSIYERRSTITSKSSNKFALRTVLSNFVNPCMGNNQIDTGWLPSPNMFVEAIDKLRKNDLDEQTISALKNTAQEQINSMEALTVLVAQIDHTHIEVWSAILRNCRIIRESSNQKSVTAAAIGLLEDIQHFDSLEIY
ncbi:MAG: hypothetical protein HQL68_04115 [Magnetococcales bacterium]|nr:hypothetical protein [Magnetococcales bacterium]